MAGRRGPSRLTGLRPIRKEIAVAFTSDEHDYLVVNDQRRTRIARHGRLGRSIRRDIARPESLSGCGIQAIEDPGRPEGEKPAGSEGGGGTRASAGYRLPKPGGVLVYPEFIPGGGLVANNR